MTARSDLQDAARAAGEMFFEDPAGCKNGHTLFYVSSGSCKQCANPPPLERWGDPGDIARVQTALNRGAVTAAQVSQATGFSTAYCQEMMIELNASRAWGDSHLTILRHQYPKGGAIPLVNVLGRSARAIRSKANLLGLVVRKPVKPRPIRVAAHNPFGL